MNYRKGWQIKPIFATVCFRPKADVHNNDLVVIWRLSVPKIAVSVLYFDRYIVKAITK